MFPIHTKAASGGGCDGKANKQVPRLFDRTHSSRSGLVKEQ